MEDRCAAIGFSQALPEALHAFDGADGAEDVQRLAAHVTECVRVCGGRARELAGLYARVLREVEAMREELAVSRPQMVRRKA